MKRKGSTTSIVIATIAGLSVLGIAGYRMMAGDCSSCAITGNEVSTQTVAAEGDSCCALKAGAEATMVSTETAAEGDSCCASKAEMVGACETGASCETPCADKAAAGAEVEMISTTTEHADDCGDCGDACAGDACGEDADQCCGKCEKGQELAKAPQ